VNEFSERVPELSQQVENLIKEERRRNPNFLRAFQDFYELCRQAINPNLTEEAVERMLVQHLLTERIFRRIFKNDDFRTRNVVAAEIEKVIAELTKRSLNRDDFLKRLEPFYHAIERNAENATEYAQKQDFLNTVYMRFFQGYSPKEADTHGIVYTPQPIVNFMVRSVEEILQKEFGRSLGDKGVYILDPFVGTGNFITRIMQEIKTTDLQYKYENELHCNEVMLLPYYIASLNIEHAYYDRTGEYQAFPGICLVDTFELAEAQQASLGFMTEENAQRVKRQKESPIFIIIGNPPYNAGQVNENDNNKNRKYPALDLRVSETYAKESRATLLRKLQDPYVKAIRWASDRLGDQGIVCFVSNSSFINNIAFDGMRARLSKDFDAIYVADLRGNIRQDSMLDRIPLGEEHTVFGLAAMVGISISFLVRNKGRRRGVFYAACPFRSTRAEKFKLIEQWSTHSGVPWRTILPDERNTWLTQDLHPEFGNFCAIDSGSAGIFAEHSLGISTNRDHVVYGFQMTAVAKNVNQFIEEYVTQIDRHRRKERPQNLDTFLDHEALKWSRNLKRHFRSGDVPEFSSSNLHAALYRPYVKTILYNSDVLVDEPAHTSRYMATRRENLLLCLTGPGSEKPFCTLASASIVDLHLVSPGCTTQCFPFYTYAEDGTHRRENITDWALEQFRSHYHDPSITKWDIFHYIYAVLHHPEYRERYAANLRRELPRIPFAGATNACHPDEAESRAKPATPEEGPMHLAGTAATADKSIDPSARKERGPQDDNGVFKAFAKIRPTPRRNPHPLRTTARIQAYEDRKEGRET
jgi:predicted helicase